MGSKINEIGNVYGRLTVLECAGKGNQGRAIWLCQCTCGTTKVANGVSLRRGITTSCGCYKRERTSECKTTHGMAGTRIYREYKDMHFRCYNPKCKGYNDYGGRGITICDEWRRSDDHNDTSGLERFAEWANANGYADALTIERTNGNSNYSPTNCEWVDELKQAQNKRKFQNNTSGYTGIIKSKSGSWYTSLEYNKKLLPSKTFKSKHDALNHRNQLILDHPDIPYGKLQQWVG